MSGGPGDLFAAAEDLLAAAASALETAPGGPILRQLVSQSAPVFDCAPQLSVHMGGPSLAVADTYPLQPPLQPMQRSVTNGFVDLVSMTITVTRCVTILEQEKATQSVLLPSPDALTSDAETCYGDLWAIWNTLFRLHREGTLFQSPSGRREFLIDPALALNNGGGVGGYEIPVRFQLGGYAGTSPLVAQVRSPEEALAAHPHSELGRARRLR